MGMNKYYTVIEVSRLLGVHRNTLYRWELEGVLVPERERVSEYRLYPRAEIDGLVRRMKAKGIEKLDKQTLMEDE